ncbi:MAG: HDOD domain-containing protein [Gammaproteobacteria bacterium]|nr:MAG: HDOD domain-containing protein [Gammaproteobacteria bacterium]
MVAPQLQRMLDDWRAEDDALNAEIEQMQPVDGLAADPAFRVRTTVLEDALGRVQVVTPEQSLLDLDSLCGKLGRDLEPLERPELEKLVQRFRFDELPALPELTGLTAVVDPAVLKHERIYVSAGEGGYFLPLSRRLFERALGKHSKAVPCAVPLAHIQVNRDDPDQDLQQINQAISQFTSLRITQRLEDTLEMPPLPETAQRIINLRCDPNAGIPELADVVETDPSLAAQVVSWASSSFYAAPGRINSVQDAIVRVLGFDLVMNLSMGLALGKTLQVPREVPAGFTPYWEQAVWTATLSGALSTAMETEDKPAYGLAYLSGLLHNFGYLVLAHVFPPHFRLILRYQQANPHLDAELTEHFLIGITREQIASQLMDVWNMPAEVVTALRHQKNPGYAGEHADYSRLIYVATQLLRAQGLSEGPAQSVPEGVWEALELSPVKAEETLLQLLELSDEMKGLAAMMASS